MTTQPLTPEDREHLAARGSQRTFKKGDVLLRQGEESRHVVLITRGRVAITTTTAGGKTILLAIRGPGDVVGELAALDRARRTATVAAMEAVTATTVTAEDFLLWLGERPDVAIRMLQVLARSLRESDRRRVDVSARDVRTRLARQLLEMGARFGVPGNGEVLLDISLSQEDLAAALGTSREAVNLALAELRQAGTVATSRMRISLLDVDALRVAALRE